MSDGLSSWLILAAMEANGTGTLTSVDWPVLGIPRLYGRPPGWLVPSQLRARWRLVLGRSERVLPSEEDQVRPLDLFLHDSEHSYENMIREFRFASSISGDGGLILSDDAFVNDALLTAAREAGLSESSVVVSEAGFSGFRVNRGHA